MSGLIPRKPLKGWTRYEQLPSDNQIQSPPELFEQSTSYSRQSTPGLQQYSTALSEDDQRSVTTFGSVFSPSWRHEVDRVRKHDPHETARYFERGRQRARLLTKGLLQWLVPAAVSGILIGIIVYYSSLPRLKRHDRYIFNGLTVGFALALGFAVASGLKSYSIFMRWRFLAANYHDLETFDLILGPASQVAMIKLLWKGRTRGRWLVPNSLQIVIAIYLFLVLAAQVAIACLGLTYSLEIAENQYIWNPGNVSIANVNMFDPYADEDTNRIRADRIAIHQYGLSSARFPVRTNVSYYQQNTTLTLWYNSSDNSMSYRFWDRCTAPECDAQAITNRWIESKARCTQYEIISGGYGNASILYYRDPDLPDEQNFTFYNQVSTVTSFFYSHVNASCGDRCNEIWVYNSGYEDEDASPSDFYPGQFYKCNNTISEVLVAPNKHDNRDAEKYQMPDLQARILAGAIGWSGITTPRFPWEVSVYPSGYVWSSDGARKYPHDWVEWYIMAFSMGAVSAIDTLGDRNVVQGDYPTTAQHVQVKRWWTAIAILAGVPGIQLLVLLVIVFTANDVPMKDESYLAAAKLLRPIVDKLGDHGTLLTGGEIAHALDNIKVVYGLREARRRKSDMSMSSPAFGGQYDTTDALRIDIIEQSEAIENRPGYGWRPGREMPTGKYY